jgi:hypothetical protein
MRPSILLTVVSVVVAGSAIRADDAKPAQKPDRQGFYKLFNGKDLEGWKPSENPETFRVEDGNLVVNGKRSHLYYVGPLHEHNWKNFHLKAEVMSFPSSNSGIYFHTEFQEGGWPEKGFECQVNETHSDVKKTGGLYDVKEVMNQSPARPNEWYTYDVIVQGKHVVLKINGKTTCDWTQPDDWKSPPGHKERVIGSGTIALQGHDPGSKVLYRSIKIKRLN